MRGRPTSTLELAVMCPLEQSSIDFGQRQLEVIVYVDGVEVNAGANWEFDGILAASVRPGHFFFSNCECGHAGCARIYWPAIVEHKGDMIHWLIPQQPWASPPNMPKRLRFDRQAYRAECERFALLLETYCQSKDDSGCQNVTNGQPFALSQFRKWMTNKEWRPSRAFVRNEKRRFKGDPEGGGYRWKLK